MGSCCHAASGLLEFMEASEAFDREMRKNQGWYSTTIAGSQLPK